MARIAAAAVGCLIVSAACSSSDSAAPSAEQLNHSAALVESVRCDGVASGSGFFISDHELVTNRHVVANARQVSVETDDDRTLAVDAVLVSSVVDAAVLRLHSVVAEPLTLGEDPMPGDDAWVVGFPRGGNVRVTTGRVVDEVEGTKFGVPGRVIRTRAEADPGNSGGPLLNRRGQVVGVVFAVEYSSGWTLAIPVSAVEQALPGMESADASC